MDENEALKEAARRAIAMADVLLKYETKPDWYYEAKEALKERNTRATDFLLQIRTEGI